MDALTRQLEMLRIIPRYPRKIGTAEVRRRLAEMGYEVTMRTVQRDLQNLSAPFQLICDEGKPSGWSWSADAAVLDIPGMDAMTALTFRMAQLFMTPLLPPSCLGYLDPHFRQAARILEADGPGPRSWPRKVASVSRHFSLRAPCIPDGVLETVYQALYEGKRFRVDYQRRGETGSVERVVNPLGLVFADEVVYLVCTLWDYEQVLTLVLHRISAAELLDEPARAPKGFRLDEYVARGSFGFPPRTGKTIKLRARFDRETAVHLQETPLSEDQAWTEDGKRVLVEATVPDSNQLRWWLQGFGDLVEVLGPAELRKEFAALSRGMARMYERKEKRP